MHKHNNHKNLAFLNSL